MYNKTTYKLIANLGTSRFIDRTSSGVNPPAGYLSKVPSLWVGKGFELIVECYERYAASSGEKSEFGAAATTKLYLKRKDSTEDAVELCTGTITQSGGTGEYYICTYIVPADTIPATLDNVDCILFADINDTGNEDGFAQHVKVISENGAGNATLDTGDIDLSMTEITGDMTLIPRTGYVQYLVTANATITLPDATEGVQMIDITADAGVTVTLVSPAITIDRQGTATLFSDGTSWRNLNFTTVVR